MPENQRLFIAVFPPPPLREALFKIAQQQYIHLGGRCMPQANLHLTLTFLGQTPTTSIPSILEQLQGMPALDCEFNIDTLGSFANGGIHWAGSQCLPSALTEWVLQLHMRLKNQHIAFDQHSYRPHITLLRKAAPMECVLDPALSWTLGTAQLYASHPGPDGPSYQVVSSCS